MTTRLEKKLDAKCDLLMRKLDEILNGGNSKDRPAPRAHSRQATDGDGALCYAGAQPRSRTNYKTNHRGWTRAAPSRPGWTNPVASEADACPKTRLPTRPQIRSVPDLTTVSHDITIYAPMLEPLKRNLKTLITKLWKSTERGERPRRTLKKPKSYMEESDCCIYT